MVNQTVQLVLLAKGGFKERMFEELNAAKLAGHLSIRKTLAVLYKWVL